MMTAIIAIRFRSLLWFRLALFAMSFAAFVCVASSGKGSCSAAYDAQGCLSTGYDGRSLLAFAYDFAPMLTVEKETEPAARASAFFAKFAKFLAAEGGVDLTLKYKAGWAGAQRAPADAKAAALTEADTVVTRAPVRSGTAQARYRQAAGLGSGVDADHIVDLQLSGADEILKMRGLDMSVNRSLGSQINQQIKGLPVGTRDNNVRMVDPST